MYFTNKDIEKEYIEYMKCLKSMNSEYINLKNSREYRTGREILLLIDNIKSGKIKELLKLINKKKKLNNASGIEKKSQYKADINKTGYPDYFSNERIAIYTCIIGNYDKILEPVFCPDNCDFYLITDMDRKLKGSIWKQVLINPGKYGISEMSNTEINRFFKMHPYVVFDKYKYSIYIDGNVRVISDLTELINKIPGCGIAVHSHSKRDCVYEEAKTILALGKDSEKNIKRHLTYLKKVGFPEHYGLLECNIIARKHNVPLCKKLMEDWWHDFLNLSKRDQMALPYVLYRNGITTKEIATLGTGVENNYSVRVEGHL